MYHGMRCPICGNETDFDVKVECWVNTCPAGQSFSQVSWSDDSPARCCKCGDEPDKTYGHFHMAWVRAHRTW